MASITARANGYQAEVRRKGHPSVSRVFGTRKEAEAWARQVEADIDRGKSPIRGKVTLTLEQALKDYEVQFSAFKKGYAQERVRLAHWRAHKLAALTLDGITPSLMSDYRDQRLKKVSPSTVRLELALLSHVYSVAVTEWGLSLDNPVRRIRKPKAPGGRTRRPTAEELDAISEQLPSNEMRVFVRLAAETAMRRGELFSLTWGQVDLDRRTVYLPDTKNGSSRTVVISTRAVEQFAKLTRTMSNQPAERVFSMTHRDSASKAFARAVTAARLAYEKESVEPSPLHLVGLRLHDLRHEATSRLFERGLSTIEVASITGHKTLSMLQRYTHLSAEHLTARLG